jgi:hypothetical protein
MHNPSDMILRHILLPQMRKYRGQADIKHRTKSIVNTFTEPGPHETDTSLQKFWQGNVMITFL